MKKKQFFRMVLTFSIIVKFTGDLFPWGSLGHKTVAAIAESYCHPKTLNEIHKMIGYDVSLADISTWADDIKRKRRRTAPWHYVNIPEGQNFEFERDCQRKGCVVWAVDHFQETLSHSSDPDERLEALKFLVHFVGDLHQPLHSGYASDKGGNEINIYFLGHHRNLHHVWDDDLIEHRRLDYRAYAKDLKSRMDQKMISSWENGNAEEWIAECRTILKENVYDFSDNLLDKNYVQSNLPIAETQMIKAGVRLALILNKVFEHQTKK